ncbi:MAG: ZIP family metal transporter [Bacteroidales bacterium]|nr:ZIP family metal transporter [Bacteroidales bacterium]
MPHIYVFGFTTESGLKVGASVLLGFFIQLMLEQLTGGVEHGGSHTFHGANSCAKAQNADGKVIPMAGLMLGLCIHSFLEGMPMIDFHGDIHQGLLWGIVLHNIPISLVLISFFAVSNIKASKAFLLMLLFAVMTPLGSLVNLAILGSNEKAQSLIMGLVVGILLHVSVSILFGNNHNALTWKKILLIMIAFAAAYFTPGCPEIYG